MPEAMWLSPFTMLLKFYLDRVQFHTRYEQLKSLIETVITESQILRSSTVMAPLDSLVISLQDFEDWKASGRVFEYLDHCILRLVRKPVHYYDILADFIAAAGFDINPRHCQVDLLLVTVVDQWHFLVESTDIPTVINVSKWLVRFIEVINLRNGYVEKLPLQGETTELLSRIRYQLQSKILDTTCRAIFERTFKIRPELEVLSKIVATNITSRTVHKSRQSAPFPKAYQELPMTFLPPTPPDEHHDHTGLHQWTRHEIQDAITEGHVKALILCLCSKYVEIRKQALTGVRTFMMKLEVGCLPDATIKADMSSRGRGIVNGNRRICSLENSSRRQRRLLWTTLLHIMSESSQQIFFKWLRIPCISCTSKSTSS